MTDDALTKYERRSTLSRVELPRAVLDLGEVDVAPVLEVLDQMSDRFWKAEDAVKENAFAVFHHTQHVILRFIKDADDPRTWFELPAWQVLGPTLKPLMLKIVEPYGFRNPTFPKAMFARLAPHEAVDRHRDAAYGNLVTHKIHVPLRTHPDVTFEVSDTCIHLPVGRAFEVNNVLPHGVSNPSSVPRTHFIFEVFDDK